MKFKVGDKIEPKDGKWSCGKAMVYNADYAVIKETYSSSYKYHIYKNGTIIDTCWGCQDESNSKLMEKTMEDLQKGDVIVVNSNEYTIIERLGDIVFTASAYGTAVRSITELKERGFTIKQQEPTELTMQEVADKFGVDASKLKIKKG